MTQGQSSRLRAARGAASAFAAACLLAACASNPPAPVEDRSYGDAAPAALPETRASAIPAVAESYRVEKGDTLYAIAFKRGLDFRELASWNHIPSPYRIYVGQELRLQAPSGYVAPVAAVAAAAAETPAGASEARPAAGGSSAPNDSIAAAGAVPIAAAAKPAKPQPSMFENVPPAESTAAAAPTGTAPPSGAAPPPAAATSAAPRTETVASSAKPALAASAAPKPAETPPPKPAEAPPKPAEAAPAIPAAAAARPESHTAELAAGGVRWRWPGEGKVVGTFVAGDQTRQGIDIAGKAGEAVDAAADGEVVYSGNGLLGYGELIIIKHNANFLSAYGHNRARLVKEGDKVKAGQQIAEMGAGASARDELHFEIRKNGKPVNPLDYLPVR